MTPTILWILRLEGAAVLVVSVLAYAHVGGGWPLFAALLLVPDLFMLGYLRGRRTGAAVYNLGHTYTVPIGLGLFGLVYGSTPCTLVALIWIAHIGMDRAVGYGLKRGSGFNETHLTRPATGVAGSS